MSQDNINININETNPIVNIVSSEIVETIDINVGETIEEVVLNITEEVIQVNVNKIQGGGNQNLQQVTDEGNTTTNTITIGDINTNYSQILDTAIGTENDVTGTYAYLDNTGQLGLHNGDVESDLRNTNVTNSGVVLEFPNKTTGSYTIATTSDIPTNVGFEQNFLLMGA